MRNFNDTQMNKMYSEQKFYADHDDAIFSCIYLFFLEVILVFLTPPPNPPFFTLKTWTNLIYSDLVYETEYKNEYRV